MNSEHDEDMLSHLGKMLPVQEDAKCPCHSQSPSLDLSQVGGKGETRIAHKTFDQIQDAEDGSLVTHHGKGKGVPSMPDYTRGKRNKD